MGSFKRSLFGYRRPDVDEVVAAQKAQVLGLQFELERKLAVVEEHEREVFAREQLQGLLAGERTHRPVAERRQHRLDRIEIGDEVIDEQDRSRSTRMFTRLHPILPRPQS